MVFDDSLEKLVRLLASQPGLGKRSARRIVLNLLADKGGAMVQLARTLEDVAGSVRTCGVCGNYDVCDPCRICCDEKRDRRVLCVLSGVSDLWALERTGAYNGLYHVLGGVLSAIDGICPDDLRLVELERRVCEGDVREVILALGVTVDGQSTAHYVADMLCDCGVRITRFSHGMPMGGELDYLDDGTIATALNSRSEI